MKELRTIIEGIFDDQDESVLIKSPDSILWKMYMRNITATRQNMGTAYNIGQTTISITGSNKILNIVPMIRNISLIPSDSFNFYDYVPDGVDGLNIDVSVLLGARINGNKVPNKWTPKLLGHLVRCYDVRGSIKSIEGVDIDAYFSFVVAQVKSISNTNIHIDQSDSPEPRVQFRQCSDVPTFDNVTSNYRVIFHIDKPLNMSKFNQIFDWGTPHSIYNKRGETIFIQNASDLKNVLQSPNFNQIYTQYESLYKIADVSLKELGLDLHCPLIRVIFQDCEMFLFSPGQLAGMRRSLINEYPSLMKNLNISIILKESNFKTKDGWIVAVIPL